MKQSGIVVLVFALFGCHQPHDHFSEQIGMVKKGELILTADTNVLKKNWEYIINNGPNPQISLSTLKLMSEEKDGGYHLLAMGIDDQSKARIDLVKVKSGLYEKRINDGGMTVVCSGCNNTESVNSGCSPELSSSEEAWYCTSCNTGDCTKSVSYSSTAILSGREKD